MSREFASAYSFTEREYNGGDFHIADIACDQLPDVGFCPHLGIFERIQFHFPGVRDVSVFLEASFPSRLFLGSVTILKPRSMRIHPASSRC